MIDKIPLFILWFFVWLLLSWPPDSKQIIAGLFVSAFVTFMTIDTFRQSGAQQKRSGWPSVFEVAGKIFWFACYIVVFLWECIKANLDVAWRVLHPTLPIRPGTIRVKTELTSDTGLTFLANSITLTPGTTTVDVDKDKGYIYIHVLSLKEIHPGPETRLAVVSRFERILKRIFE